MNAIITDYDYTLSDKFMTVELLTLLEELKISPPGYKKDYADLRKKYNSGAIKYNDFVSEDMGFIKKYLKDVKYTDVLKVLREKFEPEKNLFTWSKEIQNIFNKNDWMFIIVSSSMGICIEQMQDILGFDTYLASSYEVKNSVFTGEFSCKVDGEKKTQYVAGLKSSFEKVIVVGDAPGDFGMMKFADIALLFEPNEETKKELDGDNFEIVDRESILPRLQKEL